MYFDKDDKLCIRIKVQGRVPGLDFSEKVKLRFTWHGYQFDQKDQIKEFTKFDPWGQVAEGVLVWIISVSTEVFQPLLAERFQHV